MIHGVGWSGIVNFIRPHTHAPSISWGAALGAGEPSDFLFGEKLPVACNAFSPSFVQTVSFLK